MVITNFEFENISKGKDVANALDRLWALLLDYLFLTVFLLVTLFINFLIIFVLDSIKPGLGNNNGGSIALVLFPVCIILFIIHFSQIFRPSAQSIGEKLLKIRVIPISKERISFLAAFLRAVFFCAPFMGLISICYFALNNKQSFLDVLSDTLTIKDA